MYVELGNFYILSFFFSEHFSILSRTFRRVYELKIISATLSISPISIQTVEETLNSAGPGTAGFLDELSFYFDRITTLLVQFTNYFYHLCSSRLIKIIYFFPICG